MNTSCVCRRRSKRFSCGRWVLLAAALLVSGTFHKPACGATLQALLSGGSLNVGNSLFSDWQLLSLDSTTGVNPDLSLINVNPLAGDPSNPGLQFTTASQLSVAGINAIDLLVQFRVDALSGSNSFTGHTLSLTGISFGSDGGIAYISDEVTSHLGADLGPALVIVDNVSDVTQLVSTSSFSPQSGLSVVTNVFLTGLTSSDSINLTSFTQRFSQNGAPVLAGDYNKNGTVDAADYVVWRKNDGPSQRVRHMADPLRRTVAAAARCQCECHRPRTDNVGDAHRGGCRHSFAASPDCIESAKNSINA